MQGGSYAPGILAVDLYGAKADAEGDEHTDLIGELNERHDAAADERRGDLGLVGG